MTVEESLALASMLIESYPRDVSKGTLKAYALHLADLELSSAQRAVKCLIHTSKWLPTIAEIRIQEAKLRLPAMPTVDEAWQQAQKLLSHSHQNGPPNAYVARACTLLGREDQVRFAQLAWLRMRFYELYERLTLEVRETAARGELLAWLGPEMVPLPGGDVPLRLPAAAAR